MHVDPGFENADKGDDTHHYYYLGNNTTLLCVERDRWDAPGRGFAPGHQDEGDPHHHQQKLSGQGSRCSKLRSLLCAIL